MSYSVNVTYHSPATGKTEVIGTNSNTLNDTTSRLQSRGYVIDKIEAQGAGRNVTGPVSKVVPSAQYNKTSTVIYQAGTPIGAELVKPTEEKPVSQITMTIPGGSIPNVYQQTPIKAIPETQQSIQNRQDAALASTGWMGQTVVTGKKALGPVLNITDYLWSLRAVPSPTGGITIGYTDKSFKETNTNVQAKGNVLWSNLVNKNYVEAGKNIATSSTMTDIVYPLLTGGAFKYISLGEKVAVAGGLTGKAYQYFVNPTMKVMQYGVMPAMVGTEIGVTAARNPKDLGKMGGKLALQFTLMGVGYQYTNPRYNFKGIMEPSKIVTQTLGVRNPENPTESLLVSKTYTLDNANKLVISEKPLLGSNRFSYLEGNIKKVTVKGKDIYSVMDIRPIDVGIKSDLVKVISTGKTTIIGTSRIIDPLSSIGKDNFYIATGIRYTPKGLEEPIFGISTGKYTGDINDFISTQSKGLVIGKDATVFTKGFSLGKTIYEGEAVIKKGSLSHFLSQRENTVELAMSKGVSGDKIFEEYRKVYTPKTESKDYFGSDMSAQGGLILINPSTKLDFVLPGGLSGPTELTGPPLIITPMYPQRQQAIDEDVSYSSSYWNDVKPSYNQMQTLGFNKVTINDLLPGQVQSDINKQLQGTINSQMQVQVPKLDVTQINNQDRIQQQSQRQLQQQIQRQLQIPMQITTPITEQITVPELITLTLPETITKNVEKFLKGYDVLIKERHYFKGKKRKPTTWFKANKFPLTREQALSLGGSAAEHSAAATFKIVAAEGKPGKLGFGVESWSNLNSKFYQKGNELIEKTPYRINTSGEIKGISALGWIRNKELAQMQKARPTKKEVHRKPFLVIDTKAGVKMVDIKKLMKKWRF